jgi:hypothetical protein
LNPAPNACQRNVGGNGGKTLYRMKILYLFGLIGILFTGCIGADETNTKQLVKGYNIGWWGEPRNQTLFQGTGGKQYGGVAIIPETVFAVGYNDDFIIAKQHPNNDDTISWNNINEHETWELDSIPSDTLSNQHSYVKINGKWHGISNGRNRHDELYPDKKVTNYYIIDIRTKENIYKFISEDAYNLKRKELGIPNDLIFSIVDKELE